MTTISENRSSTLTIELLNKLFDKYTFIEETERSCVEFREFSVLEKIEARHMSIQVLDIAELSEADLENLKLQVHLAKNVVHPNLIKTWDYWIHDDFLYVKTSEVQGKRLDLFLEDDRLSLKRNLEIVIQLSSLLEHLHANKIYHTFIWPKSIYVDSNYFVFVDPVYLARFFFEINQDHHRKGTASSFLSVDGLEPGGERAADIRSVCALVCYLATGYAPDMIEQSEWGEYGLDEKLIELVGRGVGSESFHCYTMVDELTEVLEAAQDARFVSSMHSTGYIKTKMHRLKATSEWSMETQAINSEMLETDFTYNEDFRENLLNDRYELGKKAESKVFNKMFEALDRKTGNRAVLVNLFDFDGAAQWSYDFRVITQQLYSVNHPHVCQVFDYALLDEMAYISCQKEEGHKLQQFHKRYRYGAKDIKQFVDQIAGAISEAHANGFFSYFLSPETIAVYGHPDGGYFYRLLCVGHDRLYALDNDIKARLDLIFQPEYYAPEMKENELLGFKTTQFILGNIIYKLILGHHPCENLSINEAFEIHNSEEGLKLQDEDVFGNVAFAKWLRTLINRDPHKRFETPAMMIGAFAGTGLDQ